MGPYDYFGGRLSGTVYGGDPEVSDMLTKVYRMYAWSNPLHPGVFPGCRKMEAEVVRMMTSGGTESLLLCCLAYRNRAYSFGITEPEMVIPASAHASFDKAGHMFGIKVRHVPLDRKTLAVDISAVKRNINSNTCMLVGSAPNYPHGVIDPIEELARLGHRHRIPVHVDCCLGGFILPFMEQCGFPVKAFDFRLPGVTSISCDTHKYALAPKGSSIIMYRDVEFLHFQYYSLPEWPGGIYASPTLAGSRCGANIAVCWATLLKYGKQGYLDSTKKIIKTARHIAKNIEKIEGLRIMGAPEASVVAFTSSVFNIYSLTDEMHKRGWNLNPLQYPRGYSPSSARWPLAIERVREWVHIAVTVHHAKEGVADRFIEDLQNATMALLKDPGNPNEGTAAVYGMAARVPDRSLISELAYVFLDTCYSTVAAPWRKGSADLADTSRGKPGR